MKKKFIFFLICFTGQNFIYSQTVKSKLTIQTSFLGPRAMPFIRDGKPGVVKSFGAPGAAKDIKANSPTTKVVCRTFNPSQGDQMAVVYTGDPVARAQEWWNVVKTDVLNNPEVDWWEGYNEPENPDPADPNLTEMKWYAAFDAERVRILAQNGRKACIGNYSLGVPDVTTPTMWPAYYPAIDAAIANGGVMGLHEYDCPMDDCFDYVKGEGWLVGRYRKVYRQHLIPDNKVIPVIFTEYGNDGAGFCKGTCKGGFGWRPNFTWQQYRDQLIWGDSLMKADDYVLGATIFCLEIYGWDSFDIGDDNLMAWLTSYVGQGSSTSPDTTPPPIPTLSSPSDGSTQTTGTPTFTWASVTDVNNQTPPVIYELQVANNSSFNPTNINQTALSSNQYTHNTALNNGTYYWHVRAKDSVSTPNISNWTATRTFTVTVSTTTDTTPPTVPSLVTPINGYTTNNPSVTFDWIDSTDVSGISGYEIQVSVDIGFGVINHTATTSNSSSVISNLSSGLYYWRVRARDNAGTPNTSAWTTPWNFTVNTGGQGTDTTAPAAVADLTVQPGLVAGDVNLRWTASGDDGNIGTLTGMYKIQYNISNLGPWTLDSAQVTISTSGVNPGTISTYNLINLSPGMYYFCIWSADENNNWSGVSNIPSVNLSVPETTLQKRIKPEGLFVTNTIPVKFGTDAQQITIYDSRGKNLLTLNNTEFTNRQIIWSGKDITGNILESGVYIYKAKSLTGRITYGTVIVAK